MPASIGEPPNTPCNDVRRGRIFCLLKAGVVFLFRFLLRPFSSCPEGTWEIKSWRSTGNASQRSMNSWSVSWQLKFRRRKPPFGRFQKYVFQNLDFETLKMTFELQSLKALSNVLDCSVLFLFVFLLIAPTYVFFTKSFRVLTWDS